MNKLPEIIYSLVDRSTIFRNDVGGIFSLKNRNDLERIIRKNRHKIKKIEEKLRRGNERKQQVFLNKLF